MNQMCCYIITTLSLTLSVPMAFASASVQAQATSGFSQRVAPYQVSIKFNAPRKKAPPVTAGGATRGFCAVNENAKSIASLTPKDKEGTDEVALTLSNRPSFFFYLPSSPARTAEFLLLTDDDSTIVYQQTFPLPERAGVVEYQLPADAPSLEVGKQYHWFITLGCDTAMGASGNPTVEGWIERTEAPSALVKALQKADSGTYATLYAESGIWHETLAFLANERRKAPTSSRSLADWRDLLKSVGLERIANEPLAN